MYCVKCKIKTDSKNTLLVKSKNNRSMLTGYCIVCGTKKCSFIKSTNGNGILNNLIGNLPVELHLPAEKGEYVIDGSFNNLKKYSYCGPGTKYQHRVREGYQGINELDSMCKLHDQFYDENQDTKTRNISDVALAHRANEIATDPKYDMKQRRDAKFVSVILKNKARFGLGIQKNLHSTKESFQQLAEELHKPIRKKFKRRHVITKGIDDVWSCDLVEMQEWSRDNKGYRYILNVVDVFSKYAWSIPLKDKTGLTVLKALKDIIKISNRKCKHIWVDKGKEFYNKHFDEWLKENDIVRYSTYGEHKSAVVERFNRTLKTEMWKRFTANNTRNWIDMLDNLMKKYNNKVHSSIGMTPIDASKEENVTKVFVYIDKKHESPTKRVRKFKVGDIVRISRIKQLFERGFHPNWTEEIFTVVEVKNTIPITYKLKDSSGEILDGSFYNEELQKTEQKVYRIEKVIRKKKIDGAEHALVKWLGYNKKYNEWIPMKNIVS